MYPVGADPFARVISVGSPVDSEDDVGGHPADPTPAIVGAGVASTQTAFYRKRSFLICQAVGAIIGIGFIFVLLYPVVRTISQHVVDASTLNIDRMAISQASNTS